MSSLTNPAPGRGFAHFYYLCVKAMRRALANYAKGSGRASRSEYWLFVAAYEILYFAIYFAVMILVTILTVFANLTGIDALYTLVNLVGIVIYIVIIGAGLALLIPSITLLVRRLHDTGKSAHYLWFYLIPCVGWIVVLVFVFGESQKGANAYGEPSDFWEDPVKR